MYTVVWTSYGVHVQVMNKDELNKKLQDELSDIEWTDDPGIFEWEHNHVGFIVKGSCVRPSIETFTKLAVP